MVSSGAEEGKPSWPPRKLGSYCLCYNCGQHLALHNCVLAQFLHPLQPKVESPDGPFGSNQGFIGLFLPKEAVDPASTGPQTHRRIAKPKAFTQVKFPCFGFLSY